jgi:hypothetical protein
MISQALEYKTAIEQWKPPSIFRSYDDPRCTLQDCLQTAEAFRWAILLYLHQAVPEIPSEPAIILAKRVLVLLAAVQWSSRTLITQVFPLLAASCELEDEEDRTWASQRWEVMQEKHKSDTYLRCIEIMCEVWNRRKAFAQRNQRTQQIAFVTHGERSSCENMDRMSIVSPVLPASIEFEKTVRGSLHWIGVMTDWKWEGMCKLTIFHDRNEEFNTNFADYSVTRLIVVTRVEETKWSSGIFSFGLVERPFILILYSIDHHPGCPPVVTSSRSPSRNFDRSKIMDRSPGRGDQQEAKDVIVESSIVGTDLSPERLPRHMSFRFPVWPYLISGCWTLIS